MTKLETLMETLGLTKEEAMELMEEDKAVDRMSMKELNASMTPEEKAAIKEATKTGERKTGSKPAAKRTYKASDEKTALFAGLKDYLTQTYGPEAVEVTKDNKLFTITLGDLTFKVDLIQGRKPKA